MTFPGGTHDLWLRYWLAATGVDTSAIKIDPIPPPQMVQNMAVGNVHGYCVGEPWNAVAVKQDIGFTHLATQDLWLNHPEKALVVHQGYASEQRDTLKKVMASVLEASKWLDEPENRSQAAETIGAEAYVNAPAAEIRSRLTGVYDLGGGLGTKDFAGDQMQFYRDGKVNVPNRSYAVWALSQYKRLGYLDTDPAYQELSEELMMRDLYAEVASAAGVPVPDDDMAPLEVKLDGVTFDPSQPQLEANRS
jgi:nitrate/nitrite transport system substrate-binding protein